MEIMGMKVNLTKIFSVLNRMAYLPQLQQAHYSTWVLSVWVLIVVANDKINEK
jgi:hypothetical protein